MQNIGCTNLMTGSYPWVQKTLIRHISKVRYKIGLQKIEEKDF